MNTKSSFYSAQGKIIETFSDGSGAMQYAKNDVVHPQKITMVYGRATIDNKNTWEFGQGIQGKEQHAGKIGYNTFSSDGLDIVGAGKNIGNRKVILRDNVYVLGKLDIEDSISGNPNTGLRVRNGMQLLNNGINVGNAEKVDNGVIIADSVRARKDLQVNGNAQIDGQLCINNFCVDQNFLAQPFPPGKKGQEGPRGPPGPAEVTANNVFEFGKGVGGKQVDAGKIGYKTWSDGLDIVGAGSSFPGRKVKIWDELYVDKIRLGPKFTMSGVGDRHGNDEWLRLFGQDDNCNGIPCYYGGFAAGKMWSSSGTFAGSDQRMKKDIISIDKEDISNLSKIKPVQYKLKEDPKQINQYGFIAQDVEKVYPHLVEEGPNGYKSLNYNGFIPLLTKKINNISPNNDTLCIGDVCVTKEELKQLKELISKK